MTNSRATETDRLTDHSIEVWQKSLYLNNQLLSIILFLSFRFLLRGTNIIYVSMYLSSVQSLQEPHIMFSTVIYIIFNVYKNMYYFKDVVLL